MEYSGRFEIRLDRHSASIPTVREKGAMMRLRLLSLLFIGVVTMFGADVAQGKECKDVSFPDQAQVDGTNLTLNGLGLRQATFLKVNVYVAALYVVKPSNDATAILESNTPKELILHFVRNVSASDLNKAWEEGFEKQKGAFKDQLAMLEVWMTDMKTGQRLSFVHKPGVGVQVEVDGAEKGTIKGDDFAKAFFSIWLGANPPNPGLKVGLLGGGCE